MTLHTFSSGEVLTSANLNANFGSLLINSISTTTAFNSSVSGASQSQSNSYEPTAITPTNLKNATYVIVEVTYSANVNSSPDYDAQASLKLESKYVGGAYTTDYDVTVAYVNGFAASGLGNQNAHSATMRWVHTLTANEIASGYQPKLTSTSRTGNDSSNAASFTNVQTVMYLMA